MSLVAPGDTDWRDMMTREDRIKVCQHIVTKLQAIDETVDETQLRERASAMESELYSTAESRTDYLRRLAGKISLAEREAQAANSVNANAAATSSGTGTEQPAQQ